MTEKNTKLSRNHWIMLGYLSIIFVAIGIYLFNVALDKSSKIKTKNYASELIDLSNFYNWNIKKGYWLSVRCTKPECGGNQSIVFLTWNKDEILEQIHDQESFPVDQSFAFFIDGLVNPEFDNLLITKWKHSGELEKYSLGQQIGYEANLSRVERSMWRKDSDEIYDFAKFFVFDDKVYVTYAIARTDTQNTMNQLKKLILKTVQTKQELKTQ